MRRSLSVRIPRSPFKSDEERSNTIKKLADIKKRHAPKALALANTALAAMKKLRELEAVLYRRKRVWPVGDCRPDDLPKAPCPGCGQADCKCTDRGTLTSYLAGDIWRGIGGAYVRITRHEKRGLMWEELRADADASFSSHIGGSLTEAGQQMPLAACAGP